MKTNSIFRFVVLSLCDYNEKQFSFFSNFEISKSATTEKIKIQLGEIYFSLEMLGVDSVKPLNKFVWPYDFLIYLTAFGFLLYRLDFVDPFLSFQ